MSAASPRANWTIYLVLGTGALPGRTQAFPVERLADATPDQRLWFEASAIMRRLGSESYPAVRDLPSQARDATIRNLIIAMVGDAAYMRGDFGAGRQLWDEFVATYPDHPMAGLMRQVRAAEAGR